MCKSVIYQEILAEGRQLGSQLGSQLGRQETIVEIVTKLNFSSKRLRPKRLRR